MTFNSFNELIAAAEAMLQAIPDKRKQHAELSALDTLATVKSRIINDGINSEGQPLGKYSEAVVPYWYFSNKPSNRNAQEQAKQLLKNRGYHVSYKDWREQHGLPTDKVTTVFTGEMWKSISSKLDQHDENITIVVISSNDEENQKKLGYLSSRYGDLLRLSEQEFAEIQEDDRQRILFCIDQYVGLT